MDFPKSSAMWIVLVVVLVALGLLLLAYCTGGLSHTVPQ